jgi:hypothetical protein
VFMVMLKYLNELSFYYFAAQTDELAQEWLRVLKRHTLKTPDTAKTEVQGMRQMD